MADLIVFDEDTDYEAVELQVKQEYAKEVSHDCCGGCGSDNLCDVQKFILGIDINKELGDEVRYEKCVESAYKLLFY